MPRIVLLLVVLLMVAAAVRSLFRALADTRIRVLHDALRDEDPVLPDELLSPDPSAWIHQRLMDTYAAERDGWALEQVRRIDARLQADVPPDQRLETVILWIPEATAFAMPGQHVYLSRRLVERAMDDEQLAFVIAHEMAHHRLGHLTAIVDKLDRVPEAARDVATNLMVARYTMLYGPEREAEADACGLNLCLAAGYDPYRCVRAFDLLEMLSLDYGDTEGVFGPDAAIEAALDGEPEWLVSFKVWLWERNRGYHPLRERKARLLEAYERAAAEQRSAEAEPAV